MWVGARPGAGSFPQALPSLRYQAAAPTPPRDLAGTVRASGPWPLRASGHLKSWPHKGFCLFVGQKGCQPRASGPESEASARGLGPGPSRQASLGAGEGTGPARPPPLQPRRRLRPGAVWLPGGSGLSLPSRGCSQAGGQSLLPLRPGAFIFSGVQSLQVGAGGWESRAALCPGRGGVVSQERPRILRGDSVPPARGCSSLLLRLAQRPLALSRSLGCPRGCA